jgi:hypothetical protein
MYYEVGYDVILKDRQEIGLFAKISQAANSDSNTKVRPNNLGSMALIKHDSIRVEVLGLRMIQKMKDKQTSAWAEKGAHKGSTLGKGLNEEE